MATGADTRASYEQLVALYAPVAAVVFVLVVVALVIVGMRFRARPGRAASSRTRAPRLEVAYAGVLVVIATLLLWRSFAEMSPASTPDATHGGAVASGGPGALTVAIVASRWNWRVLYPGGVVQTGDGHGRIATLVVPADQAVRF